MKQKKEQGLPTCSSEQAKTPTSQVKQPYEKPEVYSEALFEAVALGNGKTDVPFTCDTFQAS